MNEFDEIFRQMEEIKKLQGEEAAKEFMMAMIDMMLRRNGHKF